MQLAPVGNTSDNISRGETIQGKTMIPFETIEIGEMVAACNGGGGPLGHPRIYMNLAPAGWIECPYCSRRYVNRAVAQAGGVAGEVGVVTQSPHGPGGEDESESPAPRQVGAAGGGGDLSGGRP